MTIAPPTASKQSSSRAGVDQIWYTRCPVPTASGLAHNLGWFAEEFEADGIDVGVLQDAPPEIARHHFDHDLVGLFREGGNVPAIVARSQGAPTRLIGLTWIDEWQSIVVRPDSGISGPEDLLGRRVAVPAWAPTRAQSFPRAMALHGFKGALGLAGLSLDDVRIVEIEGKVGRAPGSDPAAAASWPGIAEVVAGDVDAAYLKGARSAEQARAAGLVVAVDLDASPDLSDRVNNGTPRPITVHERLLEEHPDVVERFLARTLAAAAWGAEHLDDVRAILGREVGAGVDGVAAAYGDTFHTSLDPDLSDDRLRLLDQQKHNLLVHGFLGQDFDVLAWAAHEPLQRARARLEAEGVTGAGLR